MAMTVYTILNAQGQVGWQATMDSVPGAAWVQSCIASNCWGKPQRTISPNMQGQLVDIDGSALNSANAISTSTVTDFPAIPAVAAKYSGISAGCLTSITLTANTAGANGDITFSADGKTNLTTLISNWNTANSTNQITLSGDGTQIPSVGSIDLTGGINLIPAVTHTAYTFAATYTVQTALATQTQDPNWIALRAKRDQLLALCDWVMFADSPVSSTDQANWKTYRASLRSIPANTTDPTAPTWPTPPTTPLISGINE